MSDPIGLAIVGLGMALEPHARSLADLADRVNVVGAYSRSAERRDAAERRGLPATGDLDALVSDPSVTAALILTPPATHLEIAQRFMEAGKHVLVEKPLEVSVVRAEEFWRLARRHDRRLGVVLQHRFRKSSIALANLLESNALGSLAAATCNIPWWRPQGYYDEPGRGTLSRDGGGVLMTQAIHTLDLFRSLVGGVEQVSAISATTSLHRMETEDFVAAGLRLNGGVPASLSATTASFPGFPEEIVLTCTQATARLSGGRLSIAYHDGRTETVEDGASTGGGADPMDFPHDAHRALLTDFLDAIENGGSPTVDGLDGLRTQDLIDALLLSAGERQWIDVPVR